MEFSRRTAVWILMLIGFMKTHHCQIADDCGRLDGCGDCIIGDSLNNLTTCVWKQCDNDSITGCVPSDSDMDNCSVFNDTSLCPASDLTTPSNSVTDATVQPTPVYSQASFDLSSFIGGIILVLGLQAGAFFAVKFLKSKDANYESIEQT